MWRAKPAAAPAEPTPWYALFNEALPQQAGVGGPALQMVVVAVCYVVLREALRPRLESFAVYAKQNTLDKRLWVARVTSNVHALVTVGLTGWTMATASWFPYYHTAEALTGPNAYTDTLAMIHSGGYFLSDWVELILTHRATGFMDGGFAMFLHHALGIAGYITSIAYNQLSLLWCAFLFTEITTPLVNNLFFLNKAGLKESKMMLYNGWTLFALWFFLRIVPVPYLAVKFLERCGDVLSAYPPLCLWQMGISLFGASFMNYMWFYRIVKGAIKMVTTGEVVEDEAIQGDDATLKQE
eukprot:CAMPEP_0118864470 /NCGR_PEP_ID=MMETSP1163-20130328/9041_1 /TAXON_ID=124430 /ORGANISM="Phaeomonas parva, Strain CCMP2877" /LENGTH=296 /DNA_ID=CAMNT_0006798605 /DNA_START=245 /DNA_END=1135 /DNA_ORIENTATION=-